MSLDLEMYNLAINACSNAHVPYSNFRVGAVLKLKNGKYIQGSNIENASYGLSNCAERSALFSAYSQGYKKEDIEKIMIIGNTKAPISPCGACRQVMQELMDLNCDVILTNLKKEHLQYKVKDLLPYSFDNEALKNE